MLTQEVLEMELEKDNPPDAVVLKRRLDTLKIPYACGWEEYDESKLCIALEADRIWEAEAAILLKNNVIEDSFIKTASGALVCEVNKNTLISVENGSICAALPSDGSAEEIIDRLINLSSAGSGGRPDHIYRFCITEHESFPSVNGTFCGIYKSAADHVHLCAV